MMLAQTCIYVYLLITYSHRTPTTVYIFETFTPILITVIDVVTQTHDVHLTLSFTFFSNFATWLDVHGLVYIFSRSLLLITVIDVVPRLMTFHLFTLFTFSRTLHVARRTQTCICFHTPYSHLDGIHDFASWRW